jgi:hypothetical protein
VRIDADKLDALLRSGKLARPRRRTVSSNLLLSLLHKLADEWGGKSYENG